MKRKAMSTDNVVEAIGDILVEQVYYIGFSSSYCFVPVYLLYYHTLKLCYSGHFFGTRATVPCR